MDKCRSRKITTQLAFITPLLFISILMAVTALKRNSDVIANSQNEVAWYVLQLNKEYAEFHHQLHRYSVGTSDHNDMMLQYEILWSRFKTILTNTHISHIYHFDGAYHQISKQFAYIQSIESQLLALQPGEPESDLIKQVKDNYENLVIFLSHKFRLSSGDLLKKVKATHAMKMLIYFLLCAIVLLGGILLWSLWLESKSMRKLAMSDTLTGIHSRLWLNHQLNELIEAKQPFRFYLIDLDGFKTVNDTLGHHAGDTLLKTVANRLAALSGEHYHVARMGGDEFAVIESLSVQHEINISQKLLNSFQQPAMLNGKPFAISASIGSSEYPLNASSMSEVLQQADFAMYEVKQRGKNGILDYQQSAPSADPSTAASNVKPFSKSV
ncbi:GGDEF domain-containing protein [Photobacterium gaetbulicola]|uniref:Putative GGDEF family protein n=1 Tax=Photobacterium gaetbulicola Gung47 TaxID=658445 RepID=A0A0C5WWI7_9GAMM|nr:GGDEF domain-containing protein [Photobacterium gaetbulicola]AJR09389.1 putative GGDEF family protein [Photobacterium gaetbulicola Gung47]PSU14192.1 GGDEF domain-containing protein [Photobacterium gaetbulicola]